MYPAGGWGWIFLTDIGLEEDFFGLTEWDSKISLALDMMICNDNDF